MKTWNLSLLVFILAGCSTFPTVWLPENAIISMPASVVDPVVIQMELGTFVASKYEYYVPNNREARYIYLGLKSDNIKKDAEYDFTEIKIRFADGDRSPVAYRYFAGDYPFGFSWGGGTHLKEAGFGGGGGRYTILLGYLYLPTEVPLALVYGDMEIAIPEERYETLEIVDGFPDQPPKNRGTR